MKHSVSARKILQNISNDQPLTKEDKKILKNLITALKKSLKEKTLTDQEKRLIKEMIRKSTAGTITASDFVTITKGLFNIAELFKDYS